MVETKGQVVQSTFSCYRLHPACVLGQIWVTSNHSCIPEIPEVFAGISLSQHAVSKFVWLEVTTLGQWLFQKIPVIIWIGTVVLGGWKYLWRLFCNCGLHLQTCDVAI